MLAAPTQSMWQTATTGLRSIIEVDWALRRAKCHGVHFLSDVVIAMTVPVTTGIIPELEAALTPEKLVERALLDHVIALLEILRPRSERDAIPTAEDRNWVQRQFETAVQAKPPRSSTFTLTPRSVLEAVGQVLSEQRREIAELRARLDAIERSGAKPKLVTPTAPGSMIA